MNKKLLIIVFLSVFAVVFALWFLVFPTFLDLVKDQPDQSKVFEVKSKINGIDYYVKYHDSTQLDIKKGIDSIFNAVDACVNLTNKNSVLYRFNHAPLDSCVDIDGAFLDLFFNADEVYECTDSAFDPSVYTLSRVWGFGPEGTSEIDNLYLTISDQAIRDSMILNYVDSVSMELEGHTGFNKITIGGDVLNTGKIDGLEQVNWACKTDTLLQVDFSAVVKGYIADKIYDYLFYKKKIRNFMISVGGQIVTEGGKPDGSPWVVEVANLFNKKGNTTFQLKDEFSTMAIRDNYSSTRKIGKEIISQTFDPRKYLPVDNGMRTVIVFGQEGTKAEAFATALMVMGPDEARDFVEVNPMETIEAYFLYEDDKGKIVSYVSPGLADIMNKK